MTTAELQREAYLDYLEMRPGVRLAFGKFRFDQQSSRVTRPMVHSVLSTRTVRTKRGNTWKELFFVECHTLDHCMLAGYLLYIPIYGRRNQVQYIFLRAALDGFHPELVTAHFVKRYKERYLEPNKINTKGMSPALYFLRSNSDMEATDFIPNNWTAEDMHNKIIWLSAQGLFVTSFEDKMRTYITFLDQENLSRYKAQVYEEEEIFQLLKKANAEEDGVKRSKLYSYIYDKPNVIGIMERFLRRVIDPSKVKNKEEVVQDSLERLKEIGKFSETIMKGIIKYEQEQDRKRFQRKPDLGPSMSEILDRKKRK